MNKVVIKLTRANSEYKSHQGLDEYNRGQIKTLERRLLSLLMRTDKEVRVAVQPEGDYVAVSPYGSLGGFDPTQEVVISERSLPSTPPQGYDWVEYPVSLDRVLYRLDLPAFTLPNSLCGEQMGYVSGFVQKPVGFEDGKPIFETCPQPEEESIESLLTKEVVET